MRIGAFFLVVPDSTPLGLAILSFSLIESNRSESGAIRSAGLPSPSLYSSYDSTDNINSLPLFSLSTSRLLLHFAVICAFEYSRIPFINFLSCQVVVLVQPSLNWRAPHSSFERKCFFVNGNSILKFSDIGLRSHSFENILTMAVIVLNNRD